MNRAKPARFRKQTYSGATASATAVDLFAALSILDPQPPGGGEPRIRYLSCSLRLCHFAMGIGLM
jgi:hypothetical protein